MISNSHSFPGADCGSDHNLVICNAKIRFRVDKKSENKAKVDVNKLQQPTTKAIFELAIKNRFEQIGELPEYLDD